MAFKSLFWLAEKMGDVVDQELRQRRESLLSELHQLHRGLESGQITNDEFDRRENDFMDALDGIDRLLKSREL